LKDYGVGVTVGVIVDVTVGVSLYILSATVYVSPFLLQDIVKNKQFIKIITNTKCFI